MSEQGLTIRKLKKRLIKIRTRIKHTNVDKTSGIHFTLTDLPQSTLPLAA